MSNYRLLLECYLSGQIPEWVWQEHLKDEVFKKWMEKTGVCARVTYKNTRF